MNAKIAEFQQKIRAEMIALMGIAAADYNNLCFEIGCFLIEKAAAHGNPTKQRERKDFLLGNAEFWTWWRAEYAQTDAYFGGEMQHFLICEDMEKRAPTQVELWAIYNYRKVLICAGIVIPDFFTYKPAKQ